ncbi:hypothetical protein [uncultured Jannaschia sp.]|uniref:hypothetical protein n=1 Tax=uncultured Jannaschia sp. TaxID=293347 RepID=UPI00262A7AFE|nr:hypothetical protein [uncultured Jannaschia sp.]
MRVLVFLFFCLLPEFALAGPWPRDRGQVYALVGHQGGHNGWSGLYLEYGGPRRLTFGLEIGGHLGGSSTPGVPGFSDRLTDGRIRAFVRAPVPLAGQGGTGLFAPWLAAVELSLGRDLRDDGRKVERLGLGASIGRDISTRYGDGWMAFDLLVSGGSGVETRMNYGAVAGIRPTDRITVELGLFGESDGDANVQLAPTIQYDFGRIGQARLGLSFDPDKDTALVLGWSRTF